MDEHEIVLDILLQRHCDAEAAKKSLARLLGEHGIPEVTRARQLWSYGSAIRELPSMADINHLQVICTARRNNNVEQSHRLTRRQER